MKVAIVFNEVYPEIENEYQTHLNKEINFKPYFDLEESDPIAEYESIASSFRKAGHDAYILNILDDINIFINDQKNNKPDVVFNLVEIYNDIAGLEMSFAGLLELMHIPYTGATPLALGNCQNKTLTKQILTSENINTPKFKFFSKQLKTYFHRLNYPLIVKPAFEDASVGIENNSIVSCYNDLKKRIDYVIEEYEQPALVEEYIDGRELNIAIIGDKKTKALPISEIDFSRMPETLYNIVSYEAKWEPYHEAYHKTIPKCPAKLPKKIENEAKEIALKCFNIMNCRDYARVDMRLSKDKELFVLEVNPNPDLTEDAGFMRSAKQYGYSYRRALVRIAEMAFERGKLKTIKQMD